MDPSWRCTLTHRPSGNMCLACEHQLRDCSQLLFSEMPALKRDPDGIVVVRCTEFKCRVVKYPAEKPT